jgi:hypothetical protein
MTEMVKNGTYKKILAKWEVTSCSTVPLVNGGK